MSPVSTRKSHLVRFGLSVVLAFALLGALATSAFAASANVRVEGASHTLFAGLVPLGTRLVLDSEGASHSETDNALSALDAAAEMGAFPFVLDNLAFGLYVSSVGGEDALPTPPWPGWSYRVNGVSPLVGADQQPVAAGDEVLWYFGTWDASPTAVVVPTTFVAVNTTATVTAQQLDADGVASALPGASVQIGRFGTVAGSDGVASLKMTAPGDYAVRVSKEGLIRSAIETLRVRYTTAFSSLSASKTRVARGTRVTLSSTLSGAGKVPAGRRVNLYVRKAGSATWAPLAHKNTSATGAVSFSVAVWRSSYYRMKFAGDSEFAPAPSTARLVTVR